MQPLNSRAERAKRWLEDAIAKLEPMKLDDRLLWRATKPANMTNFNYKALDQALELHPHMRCRFIELGIVR